MRRIGMLVAAVAMASGLAACDDVRIDKQIRIGAEAAAEPLKPAGEPTTLAPDTGATVQGYASVAEVVVLEQADAKLFGVAGGDPAMNGLHVHIAFFAGAAEGWMVFPVADVLSFRVLNQAAGRADIEVEESVMDETTGAIGSATKRYILSWEAGADGAPPAAVTITPAE